MCFPQPSIPTPATPRAPFRSSSETQARVGEATNFATGGTTVLTTPLGDPNFGKSINRTVLTGMLT